MKVSHKLSVCFPQHIAIPLLNICSFWLLLCFSLITHLFIPEIFTNDLLCVRHCQAQEINWEQDWNLATLPDCTGWWGPPVLTPYEHHQVNWDVPGQHELEKKSSPISWLAWVLLNGVYKPDGKTELLRAIEGIFSALTKEDFSESSSSSKEKRLHTQKN